MTTKLKLHTLEIACMEAKDFVPEIVALFLVYS